MKLSIIIVLYNEFEMVKRCIRSVYSQKINDIEILLVDNSNKEGINTVLKEFPRIRYIKNKANLGFGPAVNVGFKHAKGEYILVLTPDTQLLSNTIKQTLEYIEKHSNVALVGCRFFSHPRQLHESSFREYPNLTTHLYEYNILFYKLWKKFVKRDHPTMYSLEDHKKELHPKHMIGVYMLLRKKAAESVGFLDNQFQMYREETDLCKRLRDAGWDIAYLPVGGIVHYGGAEWKTFTITQSYDRYMRSTYLFFKKHHGFLYAAFAWFLGLLSSIMSIPVLFSTVILRELQKKDSQSKILLPEWIKILFWHIRYTKVILSDLLKIASDNKGVTFIIFVYILISLSQLQWGLPNSNHPFAYNMDEWAQAHSLKTTFTQGTPHVHGGGNGTVFFYVISGLLLAPFILFGFVNPFGITTSLEAIEIQQKLFEILRTQSVLYGVLSIILTTYIVQKYFKSNKFIAAFFLIINPLFLTLSFFYRYDTPVIFWILLSLLFSLRYLNLPTKKNFYISIFIAALASTIKVSAIPVVITCYIAFFLVTKQWWKHFRTIIYSGLLYVAIFILVGIPDAFISFNQFTNWFFYSSISVSAESAKNTDFGMPYGIFYLFYNYPAIFGRFSYSLFVFSSFLLLIFTIRSTINRLVKVEKYEVFLLLSFLTFVVSLIPLSVGAGGNRLLVILPFMGLIISLQTRKLFYSFSLVHKICMFILVLGIIFQTLESFSWLTTRWYADPRVVSSSWIITSIPKGSTIGIENIPIFQFVPDIILKDFYNKQYDSTFKTIYNYQMIDGNNKQYPEYVLITNEKIAEKYLKRSDKKSILTKLKKQKYKRLITFTPNYSYYSVFNNETLFYFSRITITPNTITIFKKSQ